MNRSIGVDRSLAILGAISAVAIVVLTSLRQVDTPDIFFHIALGERVLSGEWPPVLSNLYFTPIASGWEADFRNTFLGDIVLAGVNRLAGLVGVQILCLALLVASAAMLWRSAAPDSAGGWQWPSLSDWVVAAVLGFATLHLQAPRNAVFSLLLVPVALIGGERFLRRGGLMLLMGLGLLFAVWTTLHASYLLGLVVMVALATGALLDSRLRKVSLPFPASRVFLLIFVLGAACLPANPHLLHYFTLPIHRISEVFAKEVAPPSPAREARPAPTPEPARDYRVPGSLRDSHPEAVGEAEPVAAVSPAKQRLAEKTIKPSASPPRRSVFDRVVSVLFQPIWKSSGEQLISGDFYPAWKMLRYLPVSAALLLGLYGIVRVIGEGRGCRLALLLPLLATMYFAICYARGAGYLALVAVWCLADLRRRSGSRGAAEPSPIQAGALLACVVVLIFAISRGTLGTVLGENSHTFGLGGSVMLDGPVCDFADRESPSGRPFTTVLSGSFALHWWQPDKRVFVDAFFPAHSASVWESYRDMMLERSPRSAVEAFGVDSALIENARTDWQQMFLRDGRFFPAALGLGMTYFGGPRVGGEVPGECRILFDESDLLRVRNVVTRHNAAAQVINVYRFLLQNADRSQVERFEKRYARLLRTAAANVSPPMTIDRPEDLRPIPLYR